MSGNTEFEILVRADSNTGFTVDVVGSCVLGRIDMVTGSAAEAAETALGHWMLEGKASPVSYSEGATVCSVVVDANDPKAGVLASGQIGGSSAAVLRLTWPISESDRCNDLVDAIVAEFQEDPRRFLALTDRQAQQ
jgi:hypothetical protein